MDKLPNEVLQMILLPDYDHVSFQTDSSPPSLWSLMNHSTNFIDVWRGPWASRRVCRRFNDILFPVLSANLRRETLAILCFTMSGDTVAHNPWQEKPLSREHYATVCSLPVFLSAWRLSTRQTVSLLHGMYVALGGKAGGQAWPVDERGVAVVDGYAAEDAERLVLAAWEDGWLPRRGEGEPAPASVEAGACECSSRSEGYRTCPSFAGTMMARGISISLWCGNMFSPTSLRDEAPSDTIMSIERHIAERQDDILDE